MAVNVEDIKTRTDVEWLGIICFRKRLNFLYLREKKNVSELLGVFFNSGLTVYFWTEILWTLLEKELCIGTNVFLGPSKICRFLLHCIVTG